MEAAVGRSPFSVPRASFSQLRVPPARLPCGHALPGLRSGGRPHGLRASSPSPLAGGGRLDPRGDSDAVEVIGIGSRKDALIDFCLTSSSSSSTCSRLRFWTIHTRDSIRLQLLQRHHGTDVVLRNVEFPLSLNPCPPAVILVASAGHGLDHITAMELLNTVKSAGGLAVAIVLKPFNFEGQRRREEVDNLVNQLQESSNFHILVEADALLKTEVETLAEALESANNAVFLAIGTISILMSETYLKLHNSSDGEIKEVKTPELVKILESYGEAKVGFGAGYNIKSAITQAVFHCPFINGGLKDLDGLVVFTLTSACAMDEGDAPSIICTFRRITKCTRDIIFSGIHERDLEPNLIAITLLIVGCNQRILPQKKSFLSGLALRFPFLSSLIGRDLPDARDNQAVHSSSYPADSFISSDKQCMSSLDPVNGAGEYVDAFLEETETDLSSKESNCGGVESSVVSHEIFYKHYCQTSEEHQRILREQPNSWNIGSRFHIAQLWAKERAAFNGSIEGDELDVFTLPIGVKSSEQHSDCFPVSDPLLRETLDDRDTGGELSGPKNAPLTDAITEAGLEAISEVYDSAWTLLTGRKVDESRKQGLLSSRAASMLEAERESQKCWSPVMKIQYRGGMYRGRYQGGLPEGKGRLTFTDGSFYDGMWRYGKRSGLGTLCYSNGDVYQGAWRDDLMHGKGWFYFHTGDRWFANFWKGKANGEGRFYSKNGSVLFGHFKNGWRHGECLFIDVDGLRWTEMWDEGVLISRTQLEND